MEKIVLEGDAGEELSLFPLETTRLAERDYILASDTPRGDGTCYILEDRSDPASEEAVYEIVEDENLLRQLLPVFAQLLDDVDLEYQ